MLSLCLVGALKIFNALQAAELSISAVKERS